MKRKVLNIEPPCCTFIQVLDTVLKEAGTFPFPPPDLFVWEKGHQKLFGKSHSD